MPKGIRGSIAAAHPDAVEVTTASGTVRAAAVGLATGFQHRQHLADRLLGHPEGVRPEDLYDGDHPERHPVHQQREAVMGYCYYLPDKVAPWQLNDDVSKAVNRLKGLLLRSACFSELLTVRGTSSSQGTVYRWPLPEKVSLEVELDDAVDWPFDHLAVRVPEAPRAG